MQLAGSVVNAVLLTYGFSMRQEASGRRCSAVCFPAMLAFAPFYAGAVWGVWFPLGVTVFGFVVVGALIALGAWLTELDKRARRGNKSDGAQRWMKSSFWQPLGF